MLSSYHVPVEGKAVGEHPLVVKLMKGIFNVNPPKKKLCPEWDVSIVLNYLKQEPMAPVENCSLKFLTLRTCFLLGLVTFRRADDISKLSVWNKKCVVQKDRAILVPDALLKQDNQSHSGEPIEIFAFSDPDLCPVHSLKVYTERTEVLRGSTQSLFITFARPHHKPTAQTISHWLVDTIKLAYESQNKPLGKITGHSVRAMGPSWAEFKGAAVSNILRVADWASSNTFARYYRRCVSNMSNLVLSYRTDPAV